VLADASNFGDRAVTITNLGLIHYKTIFHKVIRQPNMTAIVMRPSEAYPLPHRLEPGAKWIGLAEQTPELYKMARKGRLYIILYHSHKDGSIWRRVTFR